MRPVLLAGGDPPVTAAQRGHRGVPLIDDDVVTDVGEPIRSADEGVATRAVGEPGARTGHGDDSVGVAAPRFEVDRQQVEVFVEA